MFNTLKSKILFSATLGIMLSVVHHTADATVATHDLAALQAQAEQFALAEWNHQAKIEMGRLDPNLRVAPCPSPKFSWLNRKRSGSTAILMRCEKPRWALRVPVKVHIDTAIVFMKRPLSSGQNITASDIELRPAPKNMSLDMAILSPPDAIGKSLIRSVQSNIPLRSDMLRNAQIVRNGQKVRVIVQSPSFSVTADGTATQAGGIGDAISVRMPNGRIITGRIRHDGNVEIAL